VTSLGLSLTDTLDDLINEGRIEPQLAMKILSTFDRVVTEVLADKVRARLTFKVSCLARVMPESQSLKQQELGVACSID
jgi:Transcription initiation factor IIA, gamma subunit